MRSTTRWGLDLLGVRAVRKRLRESLQLFYRTHGDESVDGYDSEAARRMGEVILRELWGAPPPPRTPSTAAAVGTAGVTRN